MECDTGNRIITSAALTRGWPQLFDLLLEAVELRLLGVDVAGRVVDELLVLGLVAGVGGAHLLLHLLHGAPEPLSEVGPVLVEAGPGALHLVQRRLGEELVLARPQRDQFTGTGRNSEQVSAFCIWCLV